MKLHVIITPNARKDEVVGWEQDPAAGKVLRVRIAAPPVDGKANARLREVLAACFNCSKSKISLDKGGTSRIKVFTIPDGSLQEIDD